MNLFKRRKLFVVTILLIFAGILMLNCLTPLIADDWSYATSKTLTDVFKYEYAHYFTTNGRSVAHIFARFFLIFNKNVFNICNSLIYIVFTLLLYMHITFGLKLDEIGKFVVYLLINLLMFVYVVSYGQIFLWLDGACNYLWTATIILAYLLPFRVYYCNLSIGFICHGFSILMFFLGFLSGWCNENTSGGAILFSIVILVLCLIEHIKLKLWMFSGIGGCIISFIIMILSPGNAHRKEYFIDNRSGFIQLIDHFVSVTNNILVNYRYLLFAIVILGTVFYYFIKDKKQTRITAAYVITAFAVFYALILSPVADGRPFFGGSIFLIITCTFLIANLWVYINKSKLGIMSYTSILFLLSGFNLVNAVVDIGRYKIHSDRRDAYVLELKEKGYNNIIVNELSPKPKTKYNAGFGLHDLENDPTIWPSTSYARYYGVDSVSAVSNEIFEKVFKNGDYALINCKNIYEYLKLIRNPKYTVIMSVNDDSSGAIDEEISYLMQQLGLTYNLEGKFRWSYIAVIDQGKVIYEEHKNELLNYYGQVSGNSIEVISSGKIYNKGNIASIKINGYEYARNSIGLNIVVFDNGCQRVVDRVAFNTWHGLEAVR